MGNSVETCLSRARGRVADLRMDYVMVASDREIVQGLLNIIEQRGTAKLVDALAQIEAMPCSMVNDSESLRHTIKQMQQIARAAMKI